MSKQQILLTIHNRHNISCGTPPEWSNCDGRYYGYFVNEYGDQWVFVYDHKTHIATLCGGDAGWEAEHRVVEGNVPSLFLGQAEADWLSACWQVVAARRDADALRS